MSVNDEEDTAAKLACGADSSAPLARNGSSVGISVNASRLQSKPDVLRGPPKPIAVEPCLGGKAAVLTVLVKLPAGPLGLPPPGQSGVTVASALIDISQQKTSDFKDKTLGLKSRKAHPPAHQGTCV
ncbi:unnamed protein product [Merluccius merluccius]